MVLPVSVADRQKDSYKDVGGEPAKMVSIVESITVPISGTVSVNEPVTVDGTVAVSSVAGTVTTTTAAGGLLAGVVFDYISITYPTSTTETWVYKSGGSGGTTTATVSLVYNATGQLTSATKT